MGDVKEKLFASFTMSIFALGDLDVIWLRREETKSQYKSKCTVCGKHYKRWSKRTVFILKAEGIVEKIKPFFFVTSCPQCADKAQENLQKIFGNRETSLNPLDIYYVKELMRKNKIIFN